MRKPLVFLCLAAMAGAQNQPGASGPRSKARLVRVDVLVHNKSGPVAGLTADDFTLLDKGKPEQIDLFTPITERDPNPLAQPLSPQVGSNLVNQRGEHVRNATVILFDRLNISVKDQAFVRKQVLALLSSLKETDVFAFYSLGTKALSVVHDFTADPGPLIRAAARLNAVQAAPADPAEQAIQKRLEAALVPEQSLDAVFRATLTGQAFASITRHFAGVPGWKKLAWISESFPLTFGSDFNRRTELERDLTVAMATLQEENVVLYPIDPGGVGAGQKDSSVPSDQPVEGSLMPNANASIPQNSGALSDLSTMQDIAAATGGDAFYNVNNIVAAVQKVVDEGDISYTLGFHPSDKTLDGRLHDLNIKLTTKHDGATVRYRKKYYAVRQDMRERTPTAAELVADPLEATAVALSGYAQPDPARPGFQKVDVSVNLNDLELEQQGDRWTGAFDLGLYIASPAGPVGSAQTINLNLTGDQLKQALLSGLVVTSAIDTKNQPVRLRAVVRDKILGSGGVVDIPVAP